MHVITDRLLVGNIYDAECPPSTVGAVLLVAEEYSIEAPSRLTYDRIPLKEFGEPDLRSLDRAVSWVEQQVKDHRVMVCCRAGMGRSVSVVMAYLCCVEGLAYDDVVKLVTARRPGAMPLPNLESGIQSLHALRQARNRASSLPR
jgi:protein-tyrosine phosphatase